MRSAEHAPVPYEKYYKLKKLKTLAFALMYKPNAPLSRTLSLALDEGLLYLGLYIMWSESYGVRPIKESRKSTRYSGPGPDIGLHLMNTHTLPSHPTTEIA